MIRKKFIAIVFSVLAVICFACGLAACGGSSTTSDDTGVIGNGNSNDLEYVQRGKEYVVSGIGTYSGTDLVIPSEYKGLPVTAIDDYAFFNNKTLNKVVIPDSITYIGGYSFYYCKMLTRVNIPVNTNFLGECAFYNCAALKEIFYDAVAMDDFTASRRVFDMAGIEGSGITVTIGACVTEIPAYLFCPENSSDTGIIPKITTVVFEDDSQCESIGADAFYNCRHLKTLTLPGTLSSIGSSAFYYCSSLENLCYESSSFTGTLSSYFSNAGRDGDGITVTIGNGVATIPDSLFSSFTKITEVVFDDDGKCTNIGNQAFSGCTSLVSISVPNTVTYIGDSAFKNCLSLTSIAIPDGVTEIAANLFYCCSSLSSVEIGSGTVSVGYRAFYGCTSLETIKIPGNVTLIDEYAFDGCSFLVSITLADGLTSIGAGAFRGCSSLTDIVIPDSVTSVGSAAFSGSSSLESITIPFAGSIANATSASSSTLFGYIFGTSSYSGGTSTRQYYSSNSYTTYYIPSVLKSVTICGGNILYGSFYNCSMLTSVTFSDSVASIDENAFYGCTSLVSIYIADLADWCSIDFGNATANPLCYGGTLYTNDDLVKFESQFVIPDGVEHIGSYVFYDYISLISVTIPESVTSIGECAFQYCNKLIEVCNLSSMSFSAGSTDNGYVAYYAKHVYTYGESKISITDVGYIFYNEADSHYLMGYIGSDTSLSLPDNIGFSYELYQYAFYSYTSIISAIIPNSVISIGNCAFSYCTSLTSMSLPDSVTSIGNFAFAYCSSLKSIVIPDSVTSIGNSSFAYCTSLASVIIPSSVITIDDIAFLSCTSLTSITIPDSVTTIGEYAFRECSSLLSISIGSGVTSIGDYAFDGCTYLMEISFNAVAMNDLLSSNFVFYNAGKNSPGVTLTIGSSATRIPAYLFNPNDTSSCAPKITAVIFEKNSQCAYIGEYSFYSCASLTSLTIGESISTICDYAFYGCTHLTEIYFNATAMNDLVLRNYVFYNAGKNESGIIVTIGAGVTSIPTRLFSPNNATSSSPNITTVIFEDASQCTIIHGYAFYDCVSLVSILIPSSLTTIESLTFYGCSSLTSVYFSGSSSEWSVYVGYDNSPFSSAIRYYYSESEPASSGNFWHYVDGEIVVWFEEEN